MSKLRLLDLFSGIGGFSLGLERSGYFETVAFCEIEPFCRRVLAKHWPKVPCYDDVRTLTAARLAADGITVDAICGGFPCQDLSTAGKQRGIAAERSGLWSEIVRLAGEIRPRFIIVENVSNLLRGPSERPGQWFGRVLGDLAELGYNAEWDCIRASDLGAWHKRTRIWIVAYPYGERELQSQGLFENVWRWIGNARQNAADAGSFGQSRPGRSIPSGHSEADQDWKASQFIHDSGWAFEPAVGRMAHGVPNGMDRIKSLGNAVVPQIPELIGRAIGKTLASP